MSLVKSILVCCLLLLGAFTVTCQLDEQAEHSNRSGRNSSAGGILGLGVLAMGCVFIVAGAFLALVGFSKTL